MLGYALTLVGFFFCLRLIPTLNFLFRCCLGNNVQSSYVAICDFFPIYIAQYGKTFGNYLQYFLEDDEDPVVEPVLQKARASVQGMSVVIATALHCFQLSNSLLFGDVDLGY